MLKGTNKRKIVLACCILIEQIILSRAARLWIAEHAPGKEVLLCWFFSLHNLVNPSLRPVACVMLDASNHCRALVLCKEQTCSVGPLLTTTSCLGDKPRQSNQHFEGISFSLLIAMHFIALLQLPEKERKKVR